MAGQTLPVFDNTTITDRRVLIDTTGLVQGTDVLLDSGNTDSGSTPNHRFRPGNVVVLRTSTGRYVEANDANGDTNGAATISAAETADADWASAVFTFTVNGGPSFTVTLGTADDTDAEVVTALNANARFAANLIADVNATLVRIRTLRAGSDAYFTVSCDLTTAYANATDADQGTDADYRITADFADLQDEDGDAVHGPCPTWTSGHFDESNLVIGGSAATSANIWAAARAVFERRGARFG